MENKIQHKRKAINSDSENETICKISRTSSVPFYVKLQEESPLRSDIHDESSYDSFHDRETDVCKDSSDESDGSERTEGFATMEFFEYEVYTSSDEDLINSDDSIYSSSGTDEFVVETAKCAFQFFKEVDALGDGNNSEYLLADTEYSDDDSKDVEFGFADYWECVKCKNKQNNPLYRFCEKCYQVRKSLFPPRPRLKKKLQESGATKRKIMDAYEDTDTLSSSDDFQTPTKKQKSSPTSSVFRQQINEESRSIGNSNKIKNYENNKQKNSAGEFSSNDKSSSFEDDEDCSEVDDTHKLLSRSPTPSESNKSLSTNTDDLLTTKIEMSSTSIIEISKVEDCSKDIVVNDKLSSQTPDMVRIKINDKSLVSRKDSPLFSPIKKLIDIDSGCSSAPSSQDICSTSSFGAKGSESSQEFFASQNTLGDETADDEDEAILERVESFSKNYKEDPEKNVQSLVRTESVDLASTLDENESNLGLCRFCYANPKNGVFVHSNCLHLCCCYKCAVKVWKKRKSCPICNGKIKNVTKLFVH